jgi:hypothetical protein
MTENNKCDYKLKKAIATGITLKFGSNVMVTNENITNELAEQMIDYRKSINSDFKLESLFEVYPKDKKKEIAKIEFVEPIVVKSENVKTDKK